MYLFILQYTIWTVVVYMTPKKIRFIDVDVRKVSTLISLIQTFTKEDDTLAADECYGYSRLGKNGFYQQVICPLEKCFNLDSILRQWNELVWQEGHTNFKRSLHLGPNL